MMKTSFSLVRVATAMRRVFPVAVCCLAANGCLAVSGDVVPQPASASTPSHLRLEITEQRLWKVDAGINWHSWRMSPDNERIAYAAERGDKWVMVVDGVAGQEYDQITIGKRWFDTDFVAFSPDSRRVAHTARRAQDWFIVIDGIEHGPYEEIIAEKTFWKGPVGYAQFSLDGKQFAHTAKIDGAWFVIVDGVVVTSYEQGDLRYFMDKAVTISQTTDTLSPDYKRRARIVEKGLEAWVEVNGEPGKRYPIYTPTRFIADVLTQCANCLGGALRDLEFSPDSQRLSYVVRLKDKAWVVVDQVEFSAYDEIKQTWFTSDSQHIVFVARRKKQYFIVVDGVESPAYQSVPPYRRFKAHHGSLRVSFDGPKKLHTFAIRDGEFLRINIEIVLT